MQASVSPVFPTSVSLVFMYKLLFSLFSPFSLFSNLQSIWYSCTILCFPRFLCFPIINQSGLPVFSLFSLFSMFALFFQPLSDLFGGNTSSVQLEGCNWVRLQLGEQVWKVEVKKIRYNWK